MVPGAISGWCSALSSLRLRHLPSAVLKNEVVPKACRVSDQEGSVREREREREIDPHLCSDCSGGVAKSV